VVLAKWLILVLSVFGLVVAPACAADDEAASGFDSPEKVYAAYCEAISQRDGAKVYRCLSDLHKRFLLGGMLFPVESARDEKTIADEYVDTERLKKLLRERLPVSDWEAMDVIDELVANKEAVFASAFKALPEKELEIRTKGTLTDVKIQGDVAEGKVVFSDQNDGANAVSKRTEHFIKTKRGWLMDFEPSFRKHLTESTSVKIKPWTGKSRPNYGSPEDVNEAFNEAIRDNDPERMWYSLTLQKRNELMFEKFMGFWERGGWGSLAAALYVDLPKLSRGDTPEERQKAFLPCIRDQQAYFSALIKWMAELRDGAKPRSAQQLKGLKITGDRARAVVWISFGSSTTTDGGRDAKDAPPTEEKKDDGFELPVYFARTKEGWRIDTATAEEEKRDDAEREKRTPETKIEIK